MFKVITVLLSLITVNAYAEFTTVVIAYSAENLPVNSLINVDAEYVAMPISISSDAKYAPERTKLINKYQELISSATNKHENIEFQQGVISLSPGEKSSFSLSNSYSQNSGANFYILSKLSNNKDIYSATQDIYAFINSVIKPVDTSLILGNISLAISSPERYRKQLLEQIKLDINIAKSIMGENYKASISGIENPVIVRQKNDKQVSLFIDYQIQLSE